jgi:methylated-DNA-[protein]-cysteine S-methyltransferase
MKWDDDKLMQVLEEMHSSEHIPPSRGRAVMRARLVGSYGVYLSVLETRLGPIGVAYRERGIVSLQLPRRNEEQAWRELEKEFPDGVRRADVPEAITNELCAYAEGRCKEFDLPVDLSGLRPFQRAVLTAIAKIPFGETRSYGWVARAIGKPGAARAVGQALHTNPIPIIIPCHRIVASDGSLGGYGGGVPMKIKLLRLEGVAV